MNLKPNGENARVEESGSILERVQFATVSQTTEISLEFIPLSDWPHTLYAVLEERIIMPRFFHAKTHLSTLDSGKPNRLHQHLLVTVFS